MQAIIINFMIPYSKKCPNCNKSLAQKQETDSCSVSVSDYMTDLNPLMFSCIKKIYDMVANSNEMLFDPPSFQLDLMLNNELCNRKRQLSPLNPDIESIKSAWLEYIEKESIRLSNNTEFCRNIIFAFCNQKNFRPIDYSSNDFHSDIKAVLLSMKDIYYNFPKGKTRFGKLYL